MTDERHRWQDHMPPAGWKLVLAVCAIFVAFLAVAGLHRAQTGEMLHEEILRAMESDTLWQAEPRLGPACTAGPSASTNACSAVD